MKKILAIMLTAIALIASGCGKDDGPDDPVKPDVPDTPVTPPTQEVEDPEGTVRLSMRNDNNGGTTLGQLYIDKADNFAVSGSGKIVDLGEMKGLGNVTYIPKKGWANKASVVPGHGYVLCEFDYSTGNPKFTRFYAIEYMTAAVTGGIIGAEIKYQTPFNGLDESLKLDTKKVSLPAEGGEVAVAISNTYFTPFTAEVTDAEMPCTVKRGAMTDMPYIYDGIIIECPETLAAEDKKATVTITTAFGRTETIEVTQMPRGEFINLGTSGTEIAMEGCEDAPLITVFTNIVLSDIRVETDAPWLTAVLETTPRENARARFRSIEGKEVEPESRATVDYMLEGVVRLTAGPNTAADSREATISLSYGSVERSVRFTQAGAGTLPEFEDLTFDAKAHDTYVNFNPGGFLRKIGLEVEDGADWCRATISQGGQTINFVLTANESMESRSAKVTAYAFDEECGSFTVTQKGVENMPTLEEEYIISADDVEGQFGFNAGDCSSMLSVNCANDHFSFEVESSTLKVTAQEVNYTDAPIESSFELVYNGTVVATSKIIHKGLEVKPQLEESYTIPQRDISTTITFNRGDYPVDLISIESENDYFSISNRSETHFTVTAKETNYSEDPIEGIINLVFQDKVIASTQVIQSAWVYEDDHLYLDKNSGVIQISVGSLPYTPKSDKSFVTAQILNGVLYLRYEATSETRSATISFDEISWKIVVHQTKYAVGDHITIDGKDCIVFRIDTGINYGTGRLIHFLSEKYKWSTENVFLGCTGSGINNTREVMSVPNWESLYPAFAAVNELNSDGTLKWYLPSYGEFMNPFFDGNIFWTSTEYNATDATTTQIYEYRERTSGKETTYHVAAMREYDFFAE